MSDRDAPWTPALRSKPPRTRCASSIGAGRPRRTLRPGSVRHIDAIVTLGGDALACRGLAGRSAAAAGCGCTLPAAGDGPRLHRKPGQRASGSRARRCCIGRAKNGPPRLLTPSASPGACWPAAGMLDLLAFTGMAAWSLLCFPLLLDFPGVELVATEGDLRCWCRRRLGARFPPPRCRCWL